MTFTAIDSTPRIGTEVRADRRALLVQAAVLWHIDGSTDDVPTRASLLSARRLSAVGGQTEFSNTYAAFEELPEGQKKSLQQLAVIHTIESIQRKI
jgi:alpha-ketoglutarate-dependent taurine dioxygenase